RSVHRTTAQTTTVKPVVLDEAHDGSLRNALVADVVLLREGRDHDERDACAGTAASVYRLGVQAVWLRLSLNTRAALAGAVQLIGDGVIRRGRGPGVGVVVPAVRVVIGDDDGGVLPVGLLLQEVDQLNRSGLLIERIGIAGMAILVSRHLDVRDRRVVAGFHRII